MADADQPRRPRPHHPRRLHRQEKLRELLALARTGPTRRQISARLYDFYHWCSRTGTAEIERLAATIETWWPCIEEFIHTGITNATSEGVNRVVKMVSRNAFGFRNPANQRLRTHAVTTRRARGHLKPTHPYIKKRPKRSGDDAKARPTPTPTPNPTPTPAANTS